MKIYRKIVIWIAAAVCAGFAVLMFWASPMFNLIRTEHPTKEDFHKFEEYSFIIAETLDSEIIPDDDVRAEYNIEKDFLLVKVESINYGYSVVSQYPISDFTLNDENGQIGTSINFEQVKNEHYTCYNQGVVCAKTKTGAIFSYSFAIIFSTGLIGALIYIILYEMYAALILFFEMIKEKLVKS